MQRILPIKKTRPKAATSHWPQGMVCLLALILGGVSTVRAQDVHFEFNGAGQAKAMTEWGVDTAWPSEDNMRQGLYHMGAAQVDVVRVNFFMFEPLDANGEIGPQSKARIDQQLLLAAMAGNKALALTPATGEQWDPNNPNSGPTHPYYLDGNGNPLPARWLALMEATQRYIGKPILALEVFNEPDFWKGMGPPQTLRDILLLVKSSPNFQGTELHAASTLSSTNAQPWYDAVADLVTHGTTHVLNGGNDAADTYINFIQHVQSSGGIAYNPELHSMAEVLFGAEYGMKGGIWWADALRPRGLLVKAVQGSRLGYAELRWKGAAAAVYRAPDAKVYGFAGSFERHGPNNSFRFISDDQAVYFDGIGPMREFMMTTWEEPQGGYVAIEQQPTIPALDGHRWKIVNRATGKVLEVVDGNPENGTDIRTGSDTNQLYQKWNITRDRSGYYNLINAATGKAADLFNWSLENGGDVRQWENFGNLNQKWWIQAKNQGYFYLHNGHSNRYMEDDVAGANNVRQWGFSGQTNQQWSFVLADDSAVGSLVARYTFEGNTSDSAGSNQGTAHGNFAYVPGFTGQAINLTGGWDFWGDHVELPVNVANSDDITIATWVYWRGGAPFQRIFDFGVDTNRYMFLTPSSDGGRMKFAITTRSWWDEQSMETTALPANQWVHVAMTLRGNTGTLFVNGVPQIAGYIFKNPSDLYVDANAAQRNFIGRSQWSDPTFNGLVDDFRIYRRALSAAEIATLVPNMKLLEDSFEGNFVNWAGASGWDKTSTQWVSGVSSARAGLGACDLTSRNLDASGRTSIDIQFWYRDHLTAGSDVTLSAYNGKRWVQIAKLSNKTPEDTWHFYQTTITDPQFMVPNFRIKFEAAALRGNKSFYLDDVLVSAKK